MLRRKQILLPDWLDDYTKVLSKKYQVSYSEIVRVMLSLIYAKTLSAWNDKYTLSVDIDDLTSVIDDHARGTIDREKTRKIVADIYYESRKILMDRTQVLKKSPPPKPDAATKSGN